MSRANLGNESGYNIERSTKETTGFSQIATAGPNVATYQNTGLAAGNTYYYSVRAVNASGSSAYSSVVKVVTPRN